MPNTEPGRHLMLSKQHIKWVSVLDQDMMRDAKPPWCTMGHRKGMMIQNPSSTPFSVSMNMVDG